MFKSATFVAALAAYAQAQDLVIPGAGDVGAAAAAAGVGADVVASIPADAGAIAEAAAAASSGAAAAGVDAPDLAEAAAAASGAIAAAAGTDPTAAAAGDIEAALGDLDSLIGEAIAGAGDAGAAGAGAGAGITDMAGAMDALLGGGDIIETEDTCNASDTGVWYADGNMCVHFDDTTCADSGCYSKVLGSPVCQTKEICDALAPSSAGLVIAIIVCLLAAVAVGILVYCLCCKSKDDNDYKQSD